MIRPLVILVFLIGSFFATAQNSSQLIKVDETIKTIQLFKNAIDLKSNITYYANYAVRLNYKKSRELISIRAFRKTTYIRAKKTNRC